MYLKVNKCSHLTRKVDRPLVLGEFQKMRLFAHWRYDLGLQVYTLGPAVSPFPQGCITLTPFPMFLPESSE